MLKIDYMQLEVGMELARPVFNNTGSRLLASSGTIINEFILRKFQDLALEVIFIKVPDNTKEQIESVAQEIQDVQNISDCNVQRLYCSIFVAYKKLVESIEKGKSISLNIIEPLISEMLLYITTNKSIIMQLTQIKSPPNYTIVHSINVTIFSLILGKSLKISPSNLLILGLGAFLHDIGKTFVEPEILNKPDKLTREEFEVVQGHTYLGYKEALKVTDIHQMIPRIILEHHERLDGSGYPYGKEANDIHLYAQIVSICDVYDALTSKNVYRSDFSPHEAIEHLFALCSEKKLDIDLIKGFLANITIYPFGSVLLLSNGNLAKVVHVTEGMPLRPVVEIIGVENKIVDLTEEPAILVTKLVHIS